MPAARRRCRSSSVASSNSKGADGTAAAAPRGRVGGAADAAPDRATAPPIAPSLRKSRRVRFLISTSARGACSHWLDGGRVRAPRAVYGNGPRPGTRAVADAPSIMRGCPPSAVPTLDQFAERAAARVRARAARARRDPHRFLATPHMAPTCAGARRPRPASSARRAAGRAWCARAAIRWSSATSPLRAARPPSSSTTTSTCSPPRARRRAGGRSLSASSGAGDRYFGRGTTDDKGPALAALFGVRAAREAGVPVGVRLLWEMEEEIGSPSLEPVLRALATREDVRTRSWSRMRPGSTGGGPPPSRACAGSSGSVFVLDTAEGEAHSGDVGGAARNPLAELDAARSPTSTTRARDA